MKKIIIILLILGLIVSGCSTKEGFNADNTLDEDDLTEGHIDIEELELLEGQDTISTSGDVEADINAVELEEDEILTEKAEAEHKTEDDVLVPQEDIEIIEEEPQVTEPEPEPDLEPEVIATFNAQVPEEIVMNIKYDNYSTSSNYLLVLGANINIREKPTTESQVIHNAFLYEKLNLESKVKGQFLERYNKDSWYKVFWKSGEEVKYGYVFETLGEPRQFQFEKMQESINKLNNLVANNEMAYISNYKNRNGIAPLYNGQTEDKYGIERYQSAPAYIEPSFSSEFRYIEDGRLISILEEKDGFIRIGSLDFEEERWVPKKFITYNNSIKELTKVVVIDRNNQNEGVFEYFDGKWNLISYIFATTGEKAQFKQPTSLGYFMAIETKPRFLYLDDVTREISGYAPYAIRFNGGAYIHGVPVNFNIVEGKLIDPGMKEYLYTIGTVPRSHKCVRNYTSHAKFLYDWVEIGHSAVIVIE